MNVKKKNKVLKQMVIFKHILYSMKYLKQKSSLIELNQKTYLNKIKTYKINPLNTQSHITFVYQNSLVSQESKTIKVTIFIYSINQK